MMSKQHYQKFADAISEITEDTEREKIIKTCINVFSNDNYRFDEEIFREWIRRKINKEDLKGLKSGGKRHLQRKYEKIMKEVV